MKPKLLMFIKLQISFDLKVDFVKIRKSNIKKNAHQRPKSKKIDKH